jgi:hypothetical protein
MQSLTIQIVYLRPSVSGGQDERQGGSCTLYLADLQLTRAQELTCPLSEAGVDLNSLEGLNQRLAEVMELNRRLTEGVEDNESSESDTGDRYVHYKTADVCHGIPAENMKFTKFSKNTSRNAFLR